MVIKQSNFSVSNFYILFLLSFYFRFLCVHIYFVVFYYFWMLEDIVTTHLVDSNVFLRGMVLSMEKFQEEDANYNNLSTSSSSSSSPSSPYFPYPYSKCKIYQFLDQHWFKLVKDLMTVVSIEAINQESIIITYYWLIILLLLL